MIGDWRRLLHVNETVNRARGVADKKIRWVGFRLWIILVANRRGPVYEE